jgi:VIT1/CCC1 family predicted Fe2+/Mn2+ transporter
MVAEEYGLGAANPSPLRAGIATFSAFAICGAVPLLPFLVDIADPLAVSIAMTGIVFVAIGAAKSRWALTAWWRSSLETLLIGGTAAGLAYLTGYLLRTIWDVSV